MYISYGVRVYCTVYSVECTLNNVECSCILYTINSILTTLLANALRDLDTYQCVCVKHTQHGPSPTPQWSTLSTDRNSL